MNIIFLARRFYPLIGGVETHTFEISKKLTELGHKITVITEDVVGPAAESVQSIEIRRIKVGKDDWFKKFRIWKELWKLKKLLSDADIIHCHDVFYWYLPFRFIFPFKKVYTTFHGYETKYPLGKKSIIVRKISEVLSNGNICIGDYIKKWYYTKPDFVLYGGVDIANNKTMNIDQDKELKIVLIGRFDDDIGVKTYIKSLDMLTQSKVKFTFSAYGEGRLTGHVKKYGVVNNFTKDLSKAMKTADIVFCSSYLLMLESLARKKIVIAVYENPLKKDYLEMSPFSNYIYICKDAEEISKVIYSIRNETWKSRAMVENGYEWAKEQTWDRVVDVYLRVWKL